jgi:hypothetical protein
MQDRKNSFAHQQDSKRRLTMVNSRAKYNPIDSPSKGRRQSVTSYGVSSSTLKVSLRGKKKQGPVAIDWLETKFYKNYILKDIHPNDIDKVHHSNFVITPGGDFTECNQLIQQLLERQALLRPKSKAMIRQQVSSWKKAQATLRILMEDMLPPEAVEREFTRHVSVERTIELGQVKHLQAVLETLEVLFKMRETL